MATPDIKASQFNPYQEENVRGSYGESRYGDRIAYLKSLRQALDAGQISVNDFVTMGKPVAEEATRIYHSLASSGSRSANAAIAAGGGRFEQVMPSLGFGTSGSGDNLKIQVKLPQNYQEQVRESLLPSNITGDQRERLLKDIPFDIELGSDRYNLEREGIRQRVQQEETAAQQKTGRQKLLDDLSGILTERTKTQFDEAVPQIAEQANVGGIFRSTGFGKALADERARLERDAQSRLSEKALEYGEGDVNAMGDILSNQQGFQTGGLSREFSLDDFSKHAAFARELAEASKPEPKGKSSGEKWVQGIGAASGVVNAGANAKKAK